MKYFILIFFIPSILFAQVEVPAEYWIDDSNFENKINEKHAFGEDDHKPIVVEFWASFNSSNCLADWDKIENAIYYRVDVATAAVAKKKYKVRMVPTILIFKDGVKEKSFKAGLDLLLPVSIDELQGSINEVNIAGKF